PRTVAYDLQGRFNLNNLSRRAEVWYPAFKRLLRLLERVEGLPEAVVAWLGGDQQRPHADGAEHLAYPLVEPPYPAATRPMSALGEMLLVKGVPEEILARLAPFVTAIPAARQTRINVNTCPPLLFQVLADQVSAADAEALAAARGETGFDSVEAFLQRPELAGEANLAAEPMVTLASEYFQVTNQVRIGRMNLATDAVIRRDAAAQSVTVVSRGWGYL